MTWCDEFVCWWLSSLSVGELGGGEASGGPALHYGPYPAPLRKGVRLWCPRLVRNSSSITNSCHPALILPCVAECRLPGEGQVLSGCPPPHFLAEAETRLTTTSPHHTGWQCTTCMTRGHAAQHSPHRRGLLHVVSKFGCRLQEAKVPEYAQRERHRWAAPHSWEWRRQWTLSVADSE
ncbi:hypothetical protein E2C01_012367 [Portunus trituberculatus]|uniref:Uncharacterized protein n=1 Tax=Portunus trituberculatus TaxID=210409 RepID=A0A5B7DDV7_PORTR|nr:hypothetical protein [Portunus trituberculatus]